MNKYWQSIFIEQAKNEENIKKTEDKVYMDLDEILNASVTNDKIVPNQEAALIPELKKAVEKEEVKTTSKKVAPAKKTTKLADSKAEEAPKTKRAYNKKK